MNQFLDTEMFFFYIYIIPFEIKTSKISHDTQIINLIASFNH